MSAAAGSPLAPPGRPYLRAVPADDTDDQEEGVPMPRSGTALPPDPALLTLASRIQATFRHSGLSLADPDTAHAFRVSLDALHPVLDGALATGLLTGAQHKVLSDMFGAAGAVPEVVSGTAPTL